MKLRTILAMGVSLAAVTGIFFSTTVAHAQDAATKPADTKPGAGAKRAKRISPLTVAIAAADLTTEQKDKVKEIMKESKDERQSAAPATGTGAGTAQTPETRAKLAEIETKLAADIKAILTPDQQTKFQTAYDTAKSERDNMAIFQTVMDKLNLTDDEKEKVKPILTEAGQAIMKIRNDDSIQRRDKATKTMEIWSDAKAKIRPLLTAEQQKSLDEVQTLRGGGRRGGKGAGAPAGGTTPGGTTGA